MIVIAVDDERFALENLVEAIEGASPTAQIHRFRYPDEALNFAKENRVDVAFLDVEMIGMNGVELADRLKLYHPDINIIFSTGYGHYRDAAFELHASGYLMKPITPEKVKQELENLRRPIVEKRKLKVQTFGNFEVYHDGKPVTFKYRRTKELFAYLVDRAGAMCTVGEIIGILFEDEGGREDYFQKLRRDLLSTLEEVGCSNAIVHQRGMLGVVVTELQCDYYDYLNKKKELTTSYFGEYMSQYSFAEYTNAQLYARFKQSNNEKS